MSLFKMDRSQSGVQLGVDPYGAAPPCRSSGSFAMFAAMRRASSRVSRLAADPARRLRLVILAPERRERHTASESSGGNGSGGKRSSIAFCSFHSSTSTSAKAVAIRSICSTVNSRFNNSPG
jgi:hypothetical protein